MTIALIPLWAGEASAEAWNDVARRIEKLVGSASITQERVHLTMPSLAENGNLVALTVSTVPAGVRSSPLHHKALRIIADEPRG